MNQANERKTQVTTHWSLTPSSRRYARLSKCMYQARMQGCKDGRKKSN